MSEQRKTDLDIVEVAPSLHDIQEGRVDDEEVFPEGGWRGWVTISGAALVQFATFGYTNSFGVYQGEYLTNYTPSQIGWIGGIQIFFVLSSGIITGRAFDRGYFHHLVISGSLLHSFSFFMLSLSHKNRYYQIFLSQGLGGGLAVGLIYIPSLAVASHYFKRNRPLAMGMVTAGTALGAVLQPIIINHLLHNADDFGKGVRISTGINSGLILIANMMMRTRLPPKKTNTFIPIAAFSRDVPYLFLLLGGILIICGFSFPVFFLQLYGSVNGVGQQFSIYCLPILNAASIIGRIVLPMLAPRCGVINLTTFLTVCMATLIFCLIAVKSVGAMIAFALLYGFFSGGGVSLTPAMLASLARDIDEIGVRIGVSFALSGILGLFAVPMAGAILTSNLYWWHAIIFAGTTMVGGALCYLISRFLLVQQKGTQIV